MCLILIILTCGSSACSQDETAKIVVRAEVRVNTVNPRLFGQNLLFAGNSLWNSRINDIDSAAYSLLKPITPTVVRFPGGSASDLYLWEDGIGFRTTAPVTPTSDAITLDDSPNWRTVKQARFVDPHGGQFGDLFQFLRQDGTRLSGVFGLQGAHPAGSAVRPEARMGQPEWFSHPYGTLEQMKLVQTLKAQPLFTVNYCTGLDEEGKLSPRVSLSQKVLRAAAWVAFLNGGADDQRPLGVDGEGHDWRTVGYWAQKRGDLGYPRPFDVTLWEVGNEVYDKNEIGFTSARNYAQDFVAFAKAMKHVDPHIRLGAVGLTCPRGRGDADATDAWNPTIIKAAQDYVDFLSLHPYYPAAGQEQVSYRSDRWFTAVMAGASQAMADLREIKRLIMAMSPPGKAMGIAITEYGIWPAASQDPRDFANLGRAVYDADLLLGLLQESAELGITLATAWNLHGSNPTAAIGYDWQTGARTRRPHYHVLNLIMNHRESNIVETLVTSPTFATTQVGNVKARSDIPLLHALACRAPDRRRLALMVINRSLSAAISTTIEFQGFTPQAEAQVWTLSGQSVRDHHENLAARVTPQSAKISNAGTHFSFTFGPHSLTIVEFQAQR
jgi:alpha-L-arabinofuranosidase